MAVDFLGALGAGSDIDSKSLVESLVQAERAPKESLINAKIDRAELEISAYGEVLSSLSSLSTAFQSLNDAADFNDYTVNINGALALDGSPAYSVQATEDIEAGITEIIVDAVATPDRWLADQGFATEDSPVNGGVSFQMTITEGVAPDTSQEVLTIPDPTLANIADAINSSNSGLTASVVDTGIGDTPLKLVVAGQLGTENAFSISTDAAVGLGFTLNTRISPAGNAELQINGVPIERSSNEIDDVITGATLTLSAPTAASSNISVTRDKTGVESRLRTLVEVFNQSEALFDDLVDPDGADDLSGALSGNGSFRVIRDGLKTLLTSESSTPGTSLTRLNDIGIEFDQTGRLQIDDDRLQSALTDNFDDVVLLLSAGTDGQSQYGEADRGVAGDAIVMINNLMSSTGTITSQVSRLESKVEGFQDELETLDRRMESIYARYLAQFTQMEKFIDQMNSMREYLDQTLSALPFTNKD